MNILALDTETAGFKWHADELAFLATTADATREVAYDLSEPTPTATLLIELQEADIIVGHNLKFDIHQVRETTGIDIMQLGKELHDTDTLARIMWPEGQYGEHGGFSLDALAKVYVNPTAGDAETELAELAKKLGYRSLKSEPGIYLEIWRAGGVFRDAMEKYAKLDVRHTWDLFALLRAEYERNPRLAAAYEIERRVMPILLNGERIGMATNQAAVKALHREYKAEERRLQDSLSKNLGDTALGGEGSEEALVEALQANGVPLKERTDTGKLATNQFALQVFETEHPIVREFLDYRRVEKFLGTYIEPMLDVSVIHTSLRQIGTWTHRMSCAQPNMQNIPVRAGNEVREVFVARPGHKLIAADYDSIEVRLLAHYLGDDGEGYRQLLLDGLDPHAWMAADLGRKGVQPFAARGSSPEQFAKGTPGAAERAIAKSILFAIVYGAGGCRICDMLNLDKGPPLRANDWEVLNTDKVEGDPSCLQGKNIARAVKASIPGYNRLMRRIKDKIKRDGFVNTIDGRKMAISKDRSYVGMSGLIQGSAAGCMKYGLVEAQDLLSAHGLGDAIRLIVHDEVLAEVPEADAVLGLACLEKGMQSATEAYDLTVPLLTSGAIMDNYGEGK